MDGGSCVRAAAIIVASILAGCGIAAEYAPPSDGATSVVQAVESIPGDRMCLGNTVALSPGAEAAVVWTRNDRSSAVDLPVSGLEAYVLPTECAAGSSCPGTRLLTTSLSSDWAWGIDGRTLFALGPDGAAAQLKPAAGVWRVVEQGPIATRHAVDLISPVRADDLGELRRQIAQQVTAAESGHPVPDGSTMRLTVGASGSSTTFVGSDGEARVGIVGRPMVRLGLTKPQAPGLEVIPDGEGNALVVAANAVREVKPNALGSQSRPFALGPYAKPFLDASSGKPMGAHTERTVRFRQPSTAHATAITKLVDGLPPSAFVRALSIDARSGRAAAIIDDMAGQRELRVVDGDARTLRSITCRGKTRRPGIELAFIDLGTPDRPLPSRLVSLPGPRKGLVLWLHGGPGEALEFGALTSSVYRYVDRGYDVLAVDYSGSAAGLDVLLRIKREGGSALTDDADAILEGLSSARLHKYASHLVHAESLGAQLALSLLGREASPFDGAVLLAPYLAHRPPEEWAVKRGFGARGDPLIQKRYEFELLGVDPSKGEDGFRSFMASNRSLRLRTPALLVFGSADPVSQPLDAAGMFLSRETIVVDGIHEAVMVHPHAWRAIDRFLAGSAR